MCNVFYLYLFKDDLLSAMDTETLRMLAMQRIQELILNPESRSLTVFPFSGMLKLNNNNSTAIPQPWLHNNAQQSGGERSDSGKSARSNQKLIFNLDFYFIIFIIIESSQGNKFPRQPRAFLCPLSSAYPPAPIYFRRLTIGTGTVHKYHKLAAVENHFF